MSKKSTRRLRFKKRLCEYILLGLLLGISYLIFFLDEHGVSIGRSWDMLSGYLFPVSLGLIGIIILISIIKVVIRVRRKRKYLNSPLNIIDRMTGEEFEEYLAAQFENMGYEVELTPLSNDYGADLVCYKNEEVLIVQAKRYNGVVGNAAVQEIVAAKGYYEATRCMVVTNSHFSPNAIALADANDVELWDRDSITEVFTQ